MDWGIGIGDRQLRDRGLGVRRIRGSGGCAVWGIGRSGIRIFRGLGDLDVGRGGIGDRGIRYCEIGDKWIGGTGWNHCDVNGVILILIEFLHGDRLMSQTAIISCLTRRSLDFLHGDSSISYTAIVRFLTRR